MEELVRTFIKNEDQNYSLFNYVRHPNSRRLEVLRQLHADCDELVCLSR